MKNLSHQIMAIAITLLSLTLPVSADTWTDPETGITWTYTVLDDGTASLGGGSWDKTAIPSDTHGTIIVPEYVNGLLVTGLADKAFYCSFMDNIVFEHPISHIGEEIFNGSYVKSIKGLENWDMSKRTYLDGIFRDCSELTKIEGLEAWDTSHVEAIGDLFAGCKSLTLEDCPYYSWDMSNLRSMALTFARSGIRWFCADWDTSNLNYYGFVFQDCGNLDHFYFTHCDFTSLISMDHVFENCSSLEGVDWGFAIFPETTYVSLEYAFAGCSRLSDIDLSGFKHNWPEPFFQIDKAFVGCTNLYEVRLPNCIGESKDYENSYECLGKETAEDWFKKAIMHETFAGCTNLQKVVGMGLKDNNWEDIYNEFLRKSTQYSPYDVNFDGTVDISDVVKIVNHVLAQ